MNTALPEKRRDLDRWIRGAAIMMRGVVARMRVPFIPTLLGLALVACRSMPPEAAPARYIVTTAPLGVGAASPGICVAVDPTDPQGIWWWEPGWSGCSSRSTGPGVFHA